ncbi:hypothetical protein EDD21DRAFT_445537 [Dissophora ornata]|nr:hypothetical protein EDD21DRAFT_445537 [Dissophora ornata]
MSCCLLIFVRPGLGRWDHGCGLDMFSVSVCRAARMGEGLWAMVYSVSLMLVEKNPTSGSCEGCVAFGFPTRRCKETF